MFAFLPVNKSAGPTSHDVVAQVRRCLPRKTKVGHTGTLDPFASGVLLLAVGKATKFADDVHGLDKSYRAVIQLGAETDTLDLTGEVVANAAVPVFDQARLNEVAAALLGRQMQAPPAYSAKKVQGKRSYALAREGLAVELPPKEIEVFELKLSPLGEGRLDCLVKCSTGTYIRALARDIAGALGTKGYLTELERTAVGGVIVTDLPTSESLTRDNINDYLVPVSTILPQYPEVELPEKALAYLVNGRPFPVFSAMPKTFLAHVGNGAEIAAIFKCEFNSFLRQVEPKQLCYIAS